MTLDSLKRASIVVATVTFLALAALPATGIAGGGSGYTPPPGCDYDPATNTCQPGTYQGSVGDKTYRPPSGCSYSPASGEVYCPRGGIAACPGYTSSPLAYDLAARGGGSDVFTIEPNGSERRRNTSSGLTSEPSWSNRARIAYRADDGLYLRNEDGTRRRRLTEGDDSAPAWAPDGRRLAFVRNGDIHLREATSVRRLTFRGGADPAWSPNGRNIVFSRAAGGNRDVYVLDVARSDVRRLTLRPTSDTDPSWSPDGRRIVFVRERNLHYIPSAGGDVLQITRTGGAEPDWGGQSGEIAYTARTSQRGVEVYRLRLGGERRRVTDHAGTPRNPAWEPPCGGYG